MRQLKPSLFFEQDSSVAVNEANWFVAETVDIVAIVAMIAMVVLRAMNGMNSDNDFVFHNGVCSFLWKSWKQGSGRRSGTAILGLTKRSEGSHMFGTPWNKNTRSRR
jgi:hypothetical protein